MATIDPKTGLPITDVSSAAIPTSALSTPQTPLPVATVADQTPIYNAAITTGTGQTQQALDLAQKQADELAAQNKYVEGSNTLSTLQSQISGKAADQASAYAQTGGVNDLYKQLSQLNVEAQGLQRQTLANPLQQQESAIGTGRVQGQVDQITAQNQRQIALKALDLGQRAAIAQGNYDVAKNLADQQIEAKYAGLTAQIEAQKTNLAALDKIVLTPAQEKRKEAQAQLLKKQEQELADKKATETAINNMLIEASPVAPPDVLARATEIQKKGGSAVQVAKALGQYGGDYYKTALLKEQIETQKSNRLTDAAQRAKIYQDMAVTTSTQSKAEADAWVANIASGKAKISDVPAKLKGLVSLGLSTATISSPENKAKIESSQAVYDLAEELKTLSGKGGAIGAGVGKTFGAVIPGYSGTAFAGSDRANYEAKFKQLKDTLAASNLDKLKGAMSDKDIEFLRNIGTALNESMSESAFDTELNKVQKTMEKVPGVRATPKPTYNKFNSALGQSATPIGGTTYVKSVGDDGSIEFNIPTK